MVWPAVIAGAATLASSAVSAIGSSQASSQAASGFSRKAIKQQRESAMNIVRRYTDSELRSYLEGIDEAQDALAEGKTGAMQILQQSTGNAQQMLTDMGVDAQKAIMGDAAMVGGIPFSTFSTQYDQAQTLPPSARTAAMGALTQQVGSSMAQVTGTDPTAATQQVATETGIAATQPQVAQAATQDAALAAAAPNDVRGQQIVEQAAATQAAGPQTGFYGAKSQLELGRLAAGQQLQQGATTARQDITTGAQTALGQLAESTEAAMGRYTPYSEAGQAAIQQEAALSGAMGAEAQQAAIDSYIESPGQKYLREQQEKALLRSSAAIGGLGGGAVRTALQEQAMGIASTQQQQYLENLRSIATRGQEVAGAEAGLLQQQGITGAGITTTASQQLASIAQQLGISQSDLLQASAQQLATLAQSTGLSVAQLQQQVGTAKAQLEQETGTNLANLESQYGSSLAGLAAGKATDVANIYSKAGTNLANIFTGSAAAENQAAQAAAQAQAAGTLAQTQAISQGLSGLGQIAGYYAGNNTGTTSYTGQSTNSNIYDTSHLY